VAKKVIVETEKMNNTNGPAADKLDLLSVLELLKSVPSPNDSLQQAA
jgi:hypothetical protein